MNIDVLCELFADNVWELAAGTIDEPFRSELLSHAEHCAHCRDEFVRLAAVADDVVLSVPEAETPRDFETRVLASRLQTKSARTGTRLLILAAAAVAVVASLSVTRMILNEGRAAKVHTSVLKAPFGTVLGSVTATTGSNPTLVVSLAGVPGDTRYRCFVRDATGVETEVGEWSSSHDYSGGGVWTVRLSSASLPHAVAVRLEDGRLVGMADFS